MDPNSRAQAIHKSISGLGTDDNDLIALISPLSPPELTDLYSSYAVLYGVPLDHALAGESVGNYKRLLRQAVLPRHMFMAQVLHDAVVRPGTDTAAVNDVIATLLPAEARLLPQVYRDRYNRDIVADVRSDTSGVYQQLVLDVLAGLRAEEGAPLVVSEIEKDVTRLLERDSLIASFNPIRVITRAIEQYKSKKSETNTFADYIVEILTRRSRAHVAAVALAYRSRAGLSFDKLICDELSGDALVLARALLYSCVVATRRGVAPVGHLCLAIRASVVGLGTDDPRLQRTAVLAAPFRTLMPSTYKSMTDASLEKDIRGDTTGNYRSLLLGLLGVNHVQQHHNADYTHVYGSARSSSHGYLADDAVPGQPCYSPPAEPQPFQPPYPCPYPQPLPMPQQQQVQIL